MLTLLLLNIKNGMLKISKTTKNYYKNNNNQFKFRFKNNKRLT